MKIGILTTFPIKRDRLSKYNIQALGLACAMRKRGENVVVYQVIQQEDGCENEIKNEYNGVLLHLMPSRCVGTHGILDVKKLDNDLDALLYFSDMQISLYAVERWARRNGVHLYLYVGVIRSHNTNWIIRCTVDLYFLFLIKVYRRHTCFVKTKEIGVELKKRHVKDVVLAPVGLDLSRVRTDYANYTSEVIKEAYGYNSEERIILFIGRMEPEKEPVKMIRIFRNYSRRDSKARLVMIGDGVLFEKASDEIVKNELKSKVRLIREVSNDEIWKFYKMADVFVNLNKVEIFGMAILEAMYYATNVIAWHAPGPDFIIDDGKTGWLVNDENEVVERLQKKNDFGEKGRDRIMRFFSWDRTSSIIQRKMNERSMI